MKPLHSSIIASTLFAAGLLTAQSAFGADICEYIAKCEDGCYTSTAKLGDILASNPEILESCEPSVLSMTESGEYISYDLPLNIAPGPISLEWDKVGSSRYVEAWPQGDSIRYSWSSTGSIVLDAASGTANPIRGFTCTVGTQGTITVKAFSPSGASETLTQTVSCQ